MDLKINPLPHHIQKGGKIMKKSAILLLAALTFGGCNGDTETTVLQSPESTARYSALGSALVALGGTVNMSYLVVPVRVAGNGKDGFQILVTIHSRDLIVNMENIDDPELQGGWTEEEKEVFHDLYGSVLLAQ